MNPMFPVILFAVALLAIAVLAGAFLIYLGIKDLGERSAQTRYGPLLIASGGAIWTTIILVVIAFFHLSA